MLPGKIEGVRIRFGEDSDGITELLALLGAYNESPDKVAFLSSCNPIEDMVITHIIQTGAISSSDIEGFQSYLNSFTP